MSGKCNLTGGGGGGGGMSAYSEEEFASVIFVFCVMALALICKQHGKTSDSAYSALPAICLLVIFSVNSHYASRVKCGINT